MRRAVIFIGGTAGLICMIYGLSMIAASMYAQRYMDRSDNKQLADGGLKHGLFQHVGG